jgi:hypothetical protein
MKAKNWIEENKDAPVLNTEQPENEGANFCGRSYNENVPFTQVNFQTFQNILDQRNGLLNSVKSNHNLNNI